MGDASTSSSHHLKKRKMSDSFEVPRKKSKKDKEHKKDRKGKGKDTSENAEFKRIRARMEVVIAPIFASNPLAGVEEMLDSMVMRYIPALKGVVLAHSNIEFITQKGKILGDCPFATFEIAFDAIVWSPEVGMRLAATINLFSPDHIGLLVHHTFNVSIPRRHIPSDQFEFEYGAAENDPEFQFQELENGMDLDLDGDKKETTNEERGDGAKWIRRMTGEKIGGEDGVVEFTVIGLTIANQMLSLIGSLQPNPFSPEHTADREPSFVPSSQKHKPESAAPDHLTMLEQLQAEHAEEEGSDVDEPFAMLAKQREEAAEVEELKKKEEKAEKKKRKKEKTKTELAEGTEGEPKKKKKKKEKSVAPP